ncbi:unnamed protein product [Macrosiphum euphorbiae]|uniref:Uncharacterized protein n=1 Tax=Macrosiphum euphorbiae TaxID=13131 RepID=A0AAV0VY87_9HEMI|nr:unnamed protein product [Macrosiphum euphorbiae]
MIHVVTSVVTWVMPTEDEEQLPLEDILDPKLDEDDGEDIILRHIIWLFGQHNTVDALRDAWVILPV